MSWLVMALMLLIGAVLSLYIQAEISFAVQAPVPMLATDAIPRPPRLRHSSSPGGNYHLVMTLPAAGDGKRATATLYASTPDRCQPLWTQTLPQEYGPRLALVTDTGHTLLLDEWINVASPFAIVVLNLVGQTIAQHSFDDIVAATGSTRADIVAQAKQGFWIAGAPTLHGPDQATVPTAGGTLTINLNNGRIRFH